MDGDEFNSCGFVSKAIPQLQSQTSPTVLYKFKNKFKLNFKNWFQHSFLNSLNLFLIQLDIFSLKRSTLFSSLDFC